MRWSRILLACVILAVAVAAGCGGDSNPFDPEETIVFQNRSGFNGVSCYVDGVVKGTVDSGKDLTIEGDYEGDRTLFASVGSHAWGPRTFDIKNHMTLYWELQ